MIEYKINIMSALADKGYTTYKIRKEKIFSEATLTKFRNNDTSITIDNINRLCCLLGMPVSKIIKYVSTDSDKEFKQKHQPKTKL